MRVQRSYERIYATGQLIFEEGEAGDVLYVLQSGGVEISRATDRGRRTLARLGPGDFFGEMSVILGEPRTARAVATTESRVLELDGETFEALCLDRPEVGIHVIRRLSARLIESERRLSALGIDDLLRPVVRALVRRAEPGADGGIRVAGSLRGLADDAGLSMPETHRALHQLLDRKLVRLVDDVLVTSDVDSLASCLDAPA